MEFININPGIKCGMRQPFTITIGGMRGDIFFLTYDEARDMIVWNMFIDDADKKKEIEKILRNHLTNQ